MFSDEIEAAEKVVDVAAEAVDAARDRLWKAAETLRQAQNNLVKLQEKRGKTVPEWPEREADGPRMARARADRPPMVGHQDTRGRSGIGDNSHRHATGFAPVTQISLHGQKIEQLRCVGSALVHELDQSGIGRAATFAHGLQTVTN